MFFIFKKLNNYLNNYFPNNVIKTKYTECKKCIYYNAWETL